MGLAESLREIAVIMNRLSGVGVIKGYALIGGMSVSAWGIPRATADIDLLVSIGTVDNIHSFCRALKREGLESELIRGDISDPIPFLVKTTQGGVPLDMIISTRKWEDDAVMTAVGVDFNGVRIPVISPEFLVVMKLKAGGPQDLLDAQMLLKITNLDMATIERLAKKLRVDKRLAKVKQMRR